jgi:DNA polymerase, archaea type
MPEAEATLETAPSVFGWDPTPGLLAFALADEGRAIRLYRRDSTGVISECVPFSPFLLADDATLVADAGGLVALDRLDGPGELCWLARFSSWTGALAARDRCRERSGTAPGTPSAPYRFFGDPAHQYLLLTGRTSFGGLRFSDLKRLALDIEVVTTAGFEFPSAARPGDRIVAIALADSAGFTTVVRGDRLSEPEMLEACSAVIAERDPDVIEGHNLFRFDLPYVEARARLHRIELAWGRDGSVLRGQTSRLLIAERSIAYRRYAVGGRHIVDTWILAQRHDVGARDLPSFALKDLARHFALAAPERTYVDATTVSETFRDAPDRLMAYAADDARETLGVGAIFSPPYFAQAQLVPFDYQATTLRGAAAKIDALVLREYVRRRRAVPKPGRPAPVGGGHVAILHQGVARPVLHVDVTSLYPSLMLVHGIAPASDSLGVFPALLRRLRDFRVRAKREALVVAEPAERAHLGALQQSFKILINAFYGYLAFANGHWNDFAAADRVTAEGRRVVNVIIERLLGLGAVPLEADTDGVYFVPPPDGADDGDALLTRLAESLPDGIHLELDGRYAAMLSYKLKTYALLSGDGRVTLKGSGFRSRGLEPFQRLLIEEIVTLLLHGRALESKQVVDRWLLDFAAHRVSPKLFARTETLQEALQLYRQRVDAGERPASGVYELALASGRQWEPGDQLSYYVTGRGARVAVNEHAKLLASWTAAHPDENVEYYQAKVVEVWERLRPFAERDGLWPYVVEEDPPGAERQLTLFEL